MASGKNLNDSKGIFPDGHPSTGKDTNGSPHKGAAKPAPKVEKKD